MSNSIPDLEAAIVTWARAWKHARDDYNGLSVAVDSGDITIEQYNDEIDAAQDALETAERELRDLVDAYEDRQVPS